MSAAPLPIDDPEDTLGARLLAQEARRNAHGTIAAQERRSVGPDVFTANEERIRSFFAELKANLISAVAHNEEPRVFEMHSAPPYIYRDRTVQYMEHPYHHVFVEFLAWCRENAVYVSFKYAHDGAGMRDWYNVQMMPERAGVPPMRPLSGTGMRS